MSTTPEAQDYIRALEQEVEGRRAWGKRQAAETGRFQSLYAHALVEMERFREQAKVTDKLRQEQGDYYRAQQAALVEALEHLLDWRQLGPVYPSHIDVQIDRDAVKRARTTLSDLPAAARAHAARDARMPMTDLPEVTENDEWKDLRPSPFDEITILRAQQAALVEALEAVLPEVGVVWPGSANPGSHEQEGRLARARTALLDLSAAARAHAERDAALERVAAHTRAYVVANNVAALVDALDGMRAALADPALGDTGG